MNLQTVAQKELTEWIAHNMPVSAVDLSAWPYKAAREAREAVYGNRVFLRGLIECTSYCRQNCYYCGLRRGNRAAKRYRLSEQEILGCCAQGNRLGFRTFVLQGGEDSEMTDAFLCRIIDKMKTHYPDCAVTLSFGERSPESYRALFQAGADRYLLRHETASADHFSYLHPSRQTAADRKHCLYQLREIGYQTGAGFMVGAPGQTPAHLAEDLIFLRELQPHMIGIGPFLPQGDTPFADQRAGSVAQTLFMLALTRLLLPKVLLPSTTALGSASQGGREQGLMAGANVVMPNLSPPEARDAYQLYDGKLSSGAESAEGLTDLCARIESVGMRPDFSRGDHITMT